MLDNSFKTSYQEKEAGDFILLSNSDKLKRYEYLLSIKDEVDTSKPVLKHIEEVYPDTVQRYLNKINDRVRRCIEKVLNNKDRYNPKAFITQFEKLINKRGILLPLCFDNGFGHFNVNKLYIFGYCAYVSDGRWLFIEKRPSDEIIQLQPKVYHEDLQEEEKTVAVEDFKKDLLNVTLFDGNKLQLKQLSPLLKKHNLSYRILALAGILLHKTVYKEDNKWKHCFYLLHVPGINQYQVQFNKTNN